MPKSHIFFILGYVVCVFGEAMIGPGKWKIYHVSFKESSVNDVTVDVHQKMVNRTHMVFNGNIIAAIPINEELSIKIEACKFVDGGCKPYQVLSDSSLINFVTKFADDNIRVGLELMGVDPPQLPLPAGKYTLENYLFDVEKLPSEYMYGHFISEVCALKMGLSVGCITCECEFFESGDDDEE